MKTYYNNKDKTFFTITNFEYTPKENEYEVNQQDYEEYHNKISNYYIATITVENGQVRFSYQLDQQKAHEHHLNELRVKRKPLLKAFDIYKSNVNYGVIEETSEEHDEIITWYNAILDLDEEAINNVPNVIKEYLQ